MRGPSSSSAALVPSFLNSYLQHICMFIDQTTNYKARYSYKLQTTKLLPMVTEEEVVALVVQRDHATALELRVLKQQFTCQYRA